MRQERTVQASIFDVFAGHEIGRELKAMSEWLDEHRALLGLVAEDLRRDGVKATGRQGLPAEAVLRCALLKQYRQLSYEELAFHLEDSASFRAFARLPLVVEPEEVGAAEDDQRDPGRDLGGDQSDAAGERPAGEAGGRSRRAAGQHRHRGADARAERQQPAVGCGAGDGAPVAGKRMPCSAAPARGWRDHCRAAKKRWPGDRVHPRPTQRVQLYRELIKITRATLAYLQRRGGRAGCRRAARPSRSGRPRSATIGR